MAGLKMQLLVRYEEPTYETAGMASAHVFLVTTFNMEASGRDT